jgi:hypothetical protein
MESIRIWQRLSCAFLYSFYRHFLGSSKFQNITYSKIHNGFQNVDWLWVIKLTTNIICILFPILWIPSLKVKSRFCSAVTMLCIFACEMLLCDWILCICSPLRDTCRRGWDYKCCKQRDTQFRWSLCAQNFKVTIAGIFYCQLNIHFLHDIYGCWRNRSAISE